MDAILYIWLVVVAAGDSNFDNTGRTHYAWVPSGEYKTVAACHTAATQLSLQPTKFRCINKTTGKQE